MHSDLLTHKQNVEKIAEQQQSKYLDLYTILPSEISMQLAESSLALGAIEDQVRYLWYFDASRFYTFHSLQSSFQLYAEDVVPGLSNTTTIDVYHRQGSHQSFFTSSSAAYELLFCQRLLYVLNHWNSLFFFSLMSGSVQRKRYPEEQRHQAELRLQDPRYLR